MVFDFLNPYKRSLVRGNLIVVFSLAVSLPMAHFPENQANPLLVIPTLLACIGTADTVRCMRRRWDWYHAGVILCVYMDIMVLSIVLFFLLYPYADWLNIHH
ncbi:MAG: permease [Acidobacteriota bacterium]|nr:permease [Acidobacteriota bacterium]